MDNIEDKEIGDNTLLIFMSDNGQPKQAQLNIPLRGHKLTPYEGGIRVPFIASWPGEIKQGSVSEDYIIIEDIFPTFLDVANINYQGKLMQDIDGISFLSLLKGKKSSQTNRPIFWHFPHTYDHLPYSAIRKGDWKLIYHHLDQRFELFNLDKDISETKNLAKQEKSRLKELSDILTHFLMESNAGMPVLKNGKQAPFPSAIF